MEANIWLESSPTAAQINKKRQAILYNMAN